MRNELTKIDFTNGSYARIYEVSSAREQVTIYHGPEIGDVAVVALRGSIAGATCALLVRNNKSTLYKTERAAHKEARRIIGAE